LEIIKEGDKMELADLEKLKRKGPVKKINSILSPEKLTQTVKPIEAANPSQTIEAKKVKDQITIDYPKEGEILNPRHYAIRISAGNGEVEVSIDGSDWIACRQCVGYHWFDWYYILPGKHKCMARIKLADGSYKKTKTISCLCIDYNNLKKTSK